jgi:DNA invertase Pin-like site-specific DNA recombinase
MTTNTRGVARYLRVSTDRQSTALQRRDLEKACEHRGWEVIEVYEDAGISGAKDREATRHRFDIIAAWSVDRLGRSLQDLVGFLSDSNGAGVHSTCTSKPLTRPLQEAGRFFR